MCVLQLSGNQAIWVRTHYTDDDSGNIKLLQEWLDNDLSYSLEDGSSWRVLDDSKLFNFEWERVFDVLPEIASAPQRYNRLVDGPETPDHECEFLADCRDRFAKRYGVRLIRRAGRGLRDGSKLAAGGLQAHSYRCG